MGSYKKRVEGTFASDGNDTRTADEVEASITEDEEAAAKVLAGVTEEAPTELGSEPEEPTAEETPEVQKEEAPELDVSSGLPLKERPVPEPETAPDPEPSEVKVGPSEATPEDQAFLDRHGFKTMADAGKSWLSASKELNQEQAKRNELEGRVSGQEQELARLKGYVEGAFEQEPEPQLTDEKLSELMSDPRQYAQHLEEQLTRKFDERYGKQVESLRDSVELEKNRALYTERASFALKNIPELRAIQAAEEKGEKPDPQYVEFGQELTAIIRTYPDMAQDNTKLVMAGEIARARVTARRSKASTPPVVTGKVKGKTTGDVYVESAKGSTPSPATKKFADMTADQMEKVLPSVNID